MKETTNVSIAGIAFRLDNEGYLQLKNYLTRIELGYKNNPDGAEILADIEARVCELILNQQSADQLVPADRIRDIIEQLGMPDDFPATDNTETDGTGTSIDRNAVLPNEENGSGHSPLPRRLYRNPEGAKLGGVCSGLGTYFNVEPVFIRLAFLAPIPLIPLSAIITHDGAPSAFFAILFSAFFLLYFLLWFSIPMARTPRQKLEMRGERITASSIQKGLQNDFRQIQPSRKSERSASIWADLVYILGRIMLFFVKFITVVVACGLLIGALAALFMTIVMMKGAAGSPEVLQIMGIHIHACDFSGTGFLLVMLSAILPMLGISYLLMGLVLQLPKLKKVLSALFGIWLIIAIFAVVIVARGQYMPGDSNDSPPQIPISQHGWKRSASAIRPLPIRSVSNILPNPKTFKPWKSSITTTIRPVVRLHPTVVRPGRTTRPATSFSEPCWSLPVSSGCCEIFMWFPTGCSIRSFRGKCYWPSPAPTCSPSGAGSWDGSCWPQASAWSSST